MVIQKLFDISLKTKNDTTQPLLVVLGNEVWETNSIRGIMCILIPEYLDSEDIIDDWVLRVKYARRVAMISIADNKNIDVYDSEKGLIKNNFSAADDDEDYSEVNDLDDKMIIDVTNEVVFLKSLIKIKFINILQRKDSTYFSDEKIECIKCSHRASGICDVYKTEDINDDCDSATSGNIKKYENGSYFNVI